MKVTKKAYTELIHQDLDFLNKHLPNMDNSLELNHIKSVLTSSIDKFYVREVKEESCFTDVKRQGSHGRIDPVRQQEECLDERYLEFYKVVEWKPIN